MTKKPPQKEDLQKKAKVKKNTKDAAGKASKNPAEPQFKAIQITPEDLAFLFGSRISAPSNAATGNPITDFFLNNIPQKLKKIDVFTEPVSERWGAKKIGEFCRQSFGDICFNDKAFLFFNKKRNLARVYWKQDGNDQLQERGLFEGTFLLPAATSDDPWVQIPRKSLAKVLKTDKPKIMP